jgi:hypothetical protein
MASLEPPTLAALRRRPPPLDALHPPARAAPLMVANPMRKEEELAGNPASTETAGQERSPSSTDEDKGGESTDEGNSVAVKAPANFHQAAAVYLLGGSTANYTGCKPENVSRCTNAEMQTHWEVAEGKIGKNERLVCHFAPLYSAGLILGVDSIGFRASSAGQGGGGFYVNAIGPHELEWDQYQGGGFRARVGRELWGEKADTVLVGGSDEEKLDVVFLIKVHESQLNAAIKVPGRDVIRVIPPDVLVEQHGYHWLPKEKIVKAFILKKGVSDIDIAGLEMKEEDSSVKVSFACGAIALVLLQVLAVSAILVDIVNPSCATQLHCNSRVGMYCDSVEPEGSGHCMYCGAIGIQGLALAPAKGSLINASAYPASRFVFRGRFVPDGLEFCEDKSNWRHEFCDAAVSYFTDPRGSSEYGQQVLTNSTLLCSHPACRGCLDHGSHDELGTASTREEYCQANQHANDTLAAQWCHNSQWFGYSTYESTMASNLRNPATTNLAAFVVAVLMVVFPVSGHLASIAATTQAVSQFGDEGEAMMMTLVTMLGYVRTYVIAPGLVMIVPYHALLNGFQAQGVLANAVVALFVLKLDTTLFEFVLPDSMRADVERFGRVQVTEMQAKRNEIGKRNASAGFCVATIIPTMFGCRERCQLLPALMLLGCTITTMAAAEKFRRKDKTKANCRVLSAVTRSIARISSFFGTGFLWAVMFNSEFQHFGTSNFIILLYLIYFFGMWAAFALDHRAVRKSATQVNTAV